MTLIENKKLIGKAVSVIASKKLGDHTIGDVGCALLSEQGNIYLGVCIDVGSGIGFCAEHSAIAAMITAGEYRIKKIVAVWKDTEGTVFILAPCGRCREFMRQIDEKNLQANVILGENKMVVLENLLPYHDHFRLLRD